MTSETPVYIKLEYEEALKSKKDMLSSEIALLKISEKIKNYQHYRIQEIELKNKLLKAIKELKTNSGKIQKALPKPKIPEILNNSQYFETETKPTAKTKKKDESLESQLQEIQNRLNELQSKGD